jgi:hypothetical protein
LATASYFYVIHELTHKLSDPIVLAATGYDMSKRDTVEGSEGYKIHEAVEGGAILADYWILKSYSDDLCQRYLHWCRQFSVRDPRNVPLDDFLKQEIQHEFSRR